MDTWRQRFGKAGLQVTIIISMFDWELKYTSPPVHPREAGTTSRRRYHRPVQLQTTIECARLQFFLYVWYLLFPSSDLMQNRKSTTSWPQHRKSTVKALGYWDYCFFVQSFRPMPVSKPDGTRVKLLKDWLHIRLCVSSLCCFLPFPTAFTDSR